MVGIYKLGIIKRYLAILRNAKDKQSEHYLLYLYYSRRDIANKASTLDIYIRFFL